MIRIKEGADVTLSAIQKKMIRVVTLPMPEECPTGDRTSVV